MTSTNGPTFGSTFYVRQAEPDWPIYVEPQPVENRDGFVVPSGHVAPLVELPPDFALVEASDVDLSNAGEIARFVGDWGLPAAHRLPVGAVRTVGDRWMVNAINQEPRDDAYPVALLQLHVLALRAMRDVYVGRSELRGDLMSNAWRAHGFTGADVGVAESERLVTDFANEALGGFRLRVHFGEEAPGVDAVDWYTGAMLQLVQEMAPAGRQVLRCHNERCGRAFTRQRGRSRYAEHQHTRGVKYCSHRCAKAQSERDRRAARAAEGKGSGER